MSKYNYTTQTTDTRLPLNFLLKNEDADSFHLQDTRYKIINRRKRLSSVLKQRASKREKADKEKEENKVTE